MTGFAAVARFCAIIVIQPVSYVLLIRGARATRRWAGHRLRMIGWLGTGIAALICLLVSLSLLQVGGTTSHLVLLAVSAYLLRCESRFQISSAGGARPYAARVVGVAGLLTFALQNVTLLNAGLTYFVATQSVILPLIAGMGVLLPGVELEGNSLLFRTRYALDPLTGLFPEVYVPVYAAQVAVVFECTGVREILFALCAIAFAPGDGAKKRKAAALSAGVIYGASVLRNNLVICLCGLDITSFEVAHSVIGALLILFALVAAILCILFLVPSIPGYLDELTGRRRTAEGAKR